MWYVQYLYIIWFILTYPFERCVLEPSFQWCRRFPSIDRVWCWKLAAHRATWRLRKMIAICKVLGMNFVFCCLLTLDSWIGPLKSWYNLSTFRYMFHHNVSFCARWNCSRCSGALVEWKNDGLGRCARAIYAKTTLLKDREGEEFGIENCQEIAHALNSMQWSAMPGIHPSTCLCTDTYV